MCGKSRACIFYRHQAVHATYGIDIQSRGNRDGDFARDRISYGPKTRNCGRTNKSSAFNKTSLSMCELWDLLDQCCCGDRPRTPDPRECGADFVISVSPMSPGKIVPGTVSWEQFQYPEPVFSPRSDVFSEPNSHASVGSSYFKFSR